MNAFNDKGIPIVSGDLYLDRIEKAVYINNEKKKIGGLTYLFLEALLLANQDIVTQEDLAEKVWNQRTVSDETIIQRASLLRRALGDKNKEYFESVRGVGYQWLKQVQPASRQASSLKPKTQDNIHKKIILISFALISGLLVIVLSIFSVSPTIEPQHTSSISGPQSLLFQRANQYAEQHTESSNKIAIQLYKQIIESSGEQPEVLFAYATALIERVAKFERTDENLQLANKVITRLEQYSTSSISINWLKGYYFDVSGDIEKAIVFYEKSLALKEHPITRTVGSLGYLYTQRGRLFEALQLNLISLNGAGLYRLLQVADILYLADLEPTASKWIRAAYQYAPNDGFTAVQYAKYLFVNRKIEAAESVLLDLHGFGIKSEDSLILAALIKIDMSQWHEAELMLSEAVSIQPDSVYASSMQYWLRQKTALNSSSTSAYNLAEDSDWPNALVASSLFLLADKEKDKAITQIEKAFDNGYRDYHWLINNPIFAELNNEVRFKEIISKMERSAKAERAKIELLELPNLNLILQGE